MKCNCLLVTIAILACVLIEHSKGSLRIIESNGKESSTTVEQSTFSLNCQYRHNSSIEPQLAFRRNQLALDGTFEQDVSRETIGNETTTTLKITNSNFLLTDGGVFSCSVDQTAVNISIRVTKQETTFPQSYRYTEDENFSIDCPIPSSVAIDANVTCRWYQDGRLVNVSRATTEDIGNIMAGRLRFTNVRLEDRGDYTCVVTLSVGNKSYTTLLRVIGKLAPLWPFIGIVLEIIALVLIIFLCDYYNKKLKVNKKS